MRMIKQIHSKGFTLIELLVAITILGMILIIAIPQVNNIRDKNKTTKYEKYSETMLTSGKLYTDSYTEDMFGNNKTGCYDIPYRELKKKNLLKDIKVDDIDCSGGITEDSFVRVTKLNDEYVYDVSIACKDSSNRTVYSKILAKTGCDGNHPDDVGPTITISKIDQWITGKTEMVKVSIQDNYGLLENIKIKYGWTTHSDGSGVTTYTTYNYKNKRNDGRTSAITAEFTMPQNKTGYYYFVVKPVDVRDAVGNYQTATFVSHPFKLDNTGPTCAGDDGSTVWTSSNRTITVQCADSHSGCEKPSYSASYTSGTTKRSSLIIRDKLNNQTTCRYDVYVDKEPPTPPTGNIGSVRGSNPTGSIQTAASGSTDTGSGVKEYRYVIKNSSSTPSKSEFTSTSKTFTRSCGTSYYAWAVAVDNVGNVSEVKSLGSTSDGVDSYSAWGSCSAPCDGGTKYRSNSCALVTTGLSADCNMQGCCSSVEKSAGGWSSCSASCGPGTQTRTVVTYSKYNNSNCGSYIERRDCTGTNCEAESEPSPPPAPPTIPDPPSSDMPTDEDCYVGCDVYHLISCNSSTNVCSYNTKNRVSNSGTINKSSCSSSAPSSGCSSPCGAWIMSASNGEVYYSMVGGRECDARSVSAGSGCSVTSQSARSFWVRENSLSIGNHCWVKVTIEGIYIYNGREYNSISWYANRCSANKYCTTSCSGTSCATD